jgi:hypothetical protein
MGAAVAELVVPALVRGQLESGDLVPFGGRGGSATFLGPDPTRLVSRLALRDPARLRDVADLAFDHIVDYLAALGRRLELSGNRHLQEALAYSAQWSDLTEPLVRSSFEQLPALFTAEAVRELAEVTIGIPYLEGWVARRMADGRTASIRAMGARAVHIIAGNSPLIAALSIIRNAVTRSDAVVKTPSNDPLTALAIARTMLDMAPDHPVTRHLSVAYWKGGDERVEAGLYRPENVEKIVAWGGFASVTHVVRYLQPGLELISLDPKRSATIIGPEAFESDDALREVARRLACDIGALNQLGCVNARVVYVASGLDDAGLARANRLGEWAYRELLALPEPVSTRAKWFDPELRGRLDALRTSPDFYRVYGGRDGEGAVVVSQLDEAVEFHRTLSGRVANLVPVDRPGDALAAVNASTQTIGIYPESLKETLRDGLGLQGGQRLVSLGYAADPHVALPQDAMEPMRRMVRWVVDEQCTPDVVTPLWTDRSTS